MTLERFKTAFEQNSQDEANRFVILGTYSVDVKEMKMYLTENKDD